MQHFIIRWRRPRKAALLPELNTYPETPPGFLSGFYPGSKLATGFRVSFDIKQQFLPELNEYPLPVVLNQYPGWFVRPTKKVRTKFELQTPPELNNYPVLILNQYPGWLIRPVKKFKTRFNLQSLPELNEYRQIGSPYPSFLEKKSIKTDFKRNHLIIAELDFYPQAAVSPAVLPAFLFKGSFKIKFNINNVSEMLQFVNIAPVAPGAVIRKVISIDSQRKGITINSQRRDVTI